MRWAWPKHTAHECWPWFSLHYGAQVFFSALCASIANGGSFGVIVFVSRLVSYYHCVHCTSLCWRRWFMGELRPTRLQQVVLHLLRTFVNFAAATTLCLLTEFYYDFGGRQHYRVFDCVIFCLSAAPTKLSKSNVCALFPPYLTSATVFSTSHWLYRGYDSTKS